MHIGIRANTDPTDRSNSPLIIKIVTPMATRPVSGRMPSMPRRLSWLRNTPFERISKITTRSTSRISPASSGFSR
ncbi:hypothetical protein ACVILI_002618 [Mesorhizobium sp. USDA 4775]